MPVIPRVTWPMRVLPGLDVERSTTTHSRQKLIGKGDGSNGTCVHDVNKRRKRHRTRLESVPGFMLSYTNKEKPKQLPLGIPALVPDM